jgi:DNA-binding response OmpR family regulator
LLVEDEDVLRVAVAKLLRKKGFSVLEAADGTEAITVIRDRKDALDVVLLDVTIPGAPSREVLAEIRRVAPKVKVIVTSAYGQSTVDATFPGMETNFFLRKPYQLTDLVGAVRSLLFIRNDSTVKATTV